MNLMPEAFIESFKKWETVYPASNKNIKIKPLDKNDGFKTSHYHVKMPGILINRSFFTTDYHIEGAEPGEYQFIMSGRGNDDYAKRHEDLVGKTIVGLVDINYIGVRPLTDDDGDIVGTVV